MSLMSLYSGAVIKLLFSFNNHVMMFLGIGGSGRASATKLAAFMSDYELFQIEITKTYTFTDWREDVKKMLRKAGFDGVSTVFLFGDHQLKVSIRVKFFVFEPGNRSDRRVFPASVSRVSPSLGC